MRIPDPWRVLAGMPDVLLLHLPIGDRGRYYHEQRAIVLRAGLLICEQRAVLWHELVHAIHGDHGYKGTPYELPRELAVQREAARLAMPWPVLRWGLDVSTDLHELVDVMKVDQDLVLFRLNHAHPAERGYIRARANRPGAGRFRNLVGTSLRPGQSTPPRLVRRRTVPPSDRLGQGPLA